jgi:hypothetical protein
MCSADQVPTQIEKIMDSSMRTQKSLCLPGRLELPECRTTHTAFPHPSRFMGLLSPIILILLCTVDRLRHQFTVSDAIAAQFICHDLPGFAAT